MPRWTRALVTGASSGIGDAMARQLAAAGTHLVVVARDEERLRTLADEVKAANQAVDVEVLAADLTDAEQRTRVEERIAADPPIDLVVNNAGFGADGLFVEVDRERLASMVELNVTALLRLSHAAAQAMVERGEGTICNISSMASLQATPGFACYGATKAYVTTLTEALAEELRGTGVTAVAVLPGLTRTEFAERAGQEEAANRLPDPLWQSAEQVAAEALDAAAKGRVVAVTGVANKVTAALTAPVPRGLKRRLFGLATNRF